MSKLNGHSGSSDADLKRLLTYDAIDMVERVCRDAGIYGDEKNRLILAHGIAHGQERRQALKDRGDSHFSMTSEEFRALAKTLGFREVMADPIVRDPILESDKSVVRTEIYYVFVRDDGAVLTTDTYTGSNNKPPSLNSARVQFAWYPPEENAWPPGEIGLSGGMRERGGNKVFLGHIDAREGMAFKLRRLAETGTLKAGWATPDETSRFDGGLDLVCEQDYGATRVTIQKERGLPVSSYGDNVPFHEVCAGVDKVNQDRIARLPVEVIHLLTGEEPEAAPAP